MGNSGIHFNVTHTDGLALIALARRPVGVDVEQLRAVSDPEGLVRRFFSAAETRHLSGTARRTAERGVLPRVDL